MITTCLMLKTNDKRKLLTHKKNLPLLQEYVNSFGAEIDLVQVDSKADILELKALAPALCNSTYDNPAKIKIITKIFPQSKRHAIRTNAGRIQSFIKKRFLSQKPISLKELKAKYQDLHVTDACLCNHLSIVKEQLINEGYQIEKISAGKYQISMLNNA